MELVTEVKELGTNKRKRKEGGASLPGTASKVEESLD